MKKILVVGIQSTFVLLMFIMFSSIPIYKQMDHLMLLFQISTVLFALLGTWVAILDPTVFLNKLPSEKTGNRVELALKLIPLLLASTAVFILTIAIQFTTPVLATILEPSYFILLIFRATYGVLSTLILLIQILIIIKSLLPIIQVLVKKEEDKAIKDGRE